MLWVHSEGKADEWEARQVRPILSLGRIQSALGEGKEDTITASTISSYSTQNKLLFKIKHLFLFFSPIL